MKLKTTIHVNRFMGIKYSFLYSETKPKMYFCQQHILIQLFENTLTALHFIAVIYWLSDELV